MQEIIIETISDSLKTIPYLFLIYFILEFIQNKLNNFSIYSNKMGGYAPLIGAVAGIIPQCGFSAAASALYIKRVIKTGTLVSVFLATSDEAIPVLFASTGDLSIIGLMISIKLISAIFFGYVLNYTFFKEESVLEFASTKIEYHSCETHKHYQSKSNYIRNSIYHTLKISFIILITMLFINLIMFYIGEQNVSNMLMSGSVYQPMITAMIGLIPGCSISVLLTELFVSGQISLGSSIAGLCTGAGFGYIVLFKNAPIKKSIKILFITYIIGVVVGMLINLRF